MAAIGRTMYYILTHCACKPELCRLYYNNNKPITVTARSKAWTVIARSNAGIMDSNPIRGMDVCVRLFCLCCPVCE
jgi:hypothetical protein